MDRRTYYTNKGRMKKVPPVDMQDRMIYRDHNNVENRFVKNRDKESSIFPLQKSKQH